MGLRGQCSGRNNQVNECSAVVLPRCCPASPCKGHLNTKSNVYCIDSAQHLTNQYLIRNHMVFHYNKILSAKAAVDCSAPKSRSSSIKLADQQKREKMKKKVAKCEEKMRVCEAVPGCCSRDCRSLLPCSLKHLLELEDRLLPCAGQAQHVSRAPCCHGEHCLVHCCPVKHTRKCCQNMHRTSYSNSNICSSKASSKRTGLSRSRSTESFVSVGCSQKTQGSNPRASSGDLLERHCECFTTCQKPFTPRTLVSDAKSFLSDYRYYTPPQRKKKNRHKQCVEAETQTDMISFRSADKVYERKVTCDEQITTQDEDKICSSDEPEGEIDDCECSILRESSRCSQKSPPRAADAEEEELLYLTFIEDVTNDILRHGLFSNRVLDELFECHIEENKNRLDEGKMRKMLDVLKSDLGCGQDSETELIHASQEASDPLELDNKEELEVSTKGHRLRKATKSEEFLETMDSSLKEPNKCESQSWSKRSTETQSPECLSEDTTETMDAGTECDICGVEFEEHPDISSTCEEALNFITCDSDLEVNKELEEFEEDFANTLHISHNYS